MKKVKKNEKKIFLKKCENCLKKMWKIVEKTIKNTVTNE